MCPYCCSSSLLRRHFFVLFILSRHISLSFLIFLLLLQLFLRFHFSRLHFIHPSIVYLTCFFRFTFRFILFLTSLPSSTLFHLLLFSSPAVMLPFRLLLSSNCTRFLPFLFFFSFTFFSSNKVLPSAISLSLVCWGASLIHVLKANPAVWILSVYGQFDWPSNRHSPTPTPPPTHPLTQVTHVSFPHRRWHRNWSLWKSRSSMCSCSTTSVTLLTHCSTASDLSKPPFHLNTLTRVLQTFALIFFMTVGTAAIQTVRSSYSLNWNFLRT